MTKHKDKILIVAVLALLCTGAAHAWPSCASGNWNQVPAGTTATATSGVGAVYSSGGLTWQCQAPTPTTDPTQSQTQTQNQTQTSTNTNNNSSTSASSSGSSSKSSSNSNSSATGGSVGPVSSSSTATGGNASATGGAGGTAIASAGNSSSGSGNSTNVSNNEQINYPRQTPPAYSPDILSTSPCVKGFSGGAAFPGGAGSLGISRIDKGCDSRQTAVIFHGIGNDLAAAKILCSTDASKRAHLSLGECSAIVAPRPVVLPTPVPVAAAVPAVPIIVTVPAPIVTVTPAPVIVQQPAPVPPAPILTKKATKRIVPPCTTGNK